MKDKLERLTTIEVVNLIVNKKAKIQDYGEGVGKLLNYQDKVYYQEGDKFYLNEMEIKK